MMFVEFMDRDFNPRSPSWGAWIEICCSSVLFFLHAVAPPRGERGLKFFVLRRLLAADVVAPPRGERGLKSSGT